MSNDPVPLSSDGKTDREVQGGRLEREWVADFTCAPNVTGMVGFAFVINVFAYGNSYE